MMLSGKSDDSDSNDEKIIFLNIRLIVFRRLARDTNKITVTSKKKQFSVEAIQQFIAELITNWNLKKESKISNLICKVEGKQCILRTEDNTFYNKESWKKSIFKIRAAHEFLFQKKMLKKDYYLIWCDQTQYELLRLINSNEDISFGKFNLKFGYCIIYSKTLEEFDEWQLILKKLKEDLSTSLYHSHLRKEKLSADPFVSGSSSSFFLSKDFFVVNLEKDLYQKKSNFQKIESYSPFKNTDEKTKNSLLILYNINFYLPKNIPSNFIFLESSDNQYNAQTIFRFLQLLLWSYNSHHSAEPLEIELRNDNKVYLYNGFIPCDTSKWISILSNIEQEILNANVEASTVNFINNVLT